VRKDVLVVILVLLAMKSVVLFTALGEVSLRDFCLRWDGEHFLHVLQGNPEDYEIVFAPLYPLTAGLLTHIGIRPWLALFITANVFSIVPPLMALRLWGRREALFLVLNPAYALFTTAPYSESLALSLLLLSYLALVENRPVLSGLLAGLGVMARYNLVIFAGVVFLYLLAKDRRAAAGFLIPLSLTGIVMLLYLTPHGGIGAYFAAERYWDLHWTDPLGQARWILRSWFTAQGWMLEDNPLYPWHWLVRNWLFISVYLAGLLILIREKRGLEFAISAPFVFFQMVVTGTPAISTPRLLLPAIPAQVAVGRALDECVFIFLFPISLLATHYATLWHVQAFFG